jgi:hypothetical protein
MNFVPVAQINLKFGTKETSILNQSIYCFWGQICAMLLLLFSVLFNG